MSAAHSASQWSAVRSRKHREKASRRISKSSLDSSLCWSNSCTMAEALPSGFHASHSLTQPLTLCLESHPCNVHTMDIWDNFSRFFAKAWSVATWNHPMPIVTSHGYRKPATATCASSRFLLTLSPCAAYHMHKSIRELLNTAPCDLLNCTQVLLMAAGKYTESGGESCKGIQMSSNDGHKTTTEPLWRGYTASLQSRNITNPWPSETTLQEGYLNLLCPATIWAK